MKFKKAYTLIEVLVVMAIMSILFSVGYVNFQDFQRRKVVTGFTDQVRGDLRLAQSYADSGQKTDSGNCNSSKTLNYYDIDIYSATRYRIEANCVGASTATVKDVTLPTGVTFASPFPSPNPLRFKILGQGTDIPSGSTWTLLISQTGTTNTGSITVNSAGKIQ